MAVKLIALDIDGTIIPPAHYGHDHEPTQRTREAVGALTAAGVHVVLASGRMFPGTLEVARHLGLPGPVVCQQGCSVHLLDGTITHEFPIEREIALEIIAYAREIGRSYEWFNPLRYIASAQSPETEQYGVVSGITPEYRPDPENAGIEPTGVASSPRPRKPATSIASSSGATATCCTSSISPALLLRSPRTPTKAMPSRFSAPTWGSLAKRWLRSATA
jgi:hydroxymethylpyrimidine pyrophosphatase-like HAD family hydrolase